MKKSTINILWKSVLIEEIIIFSLINNLITEWYRISITKKWLIVSQSIVALQRLIPLAVFILLKILK